MMLAVGMGPTQVAVELNLAEDPSRDRLETCLLHCSFLNCGHRLSPCSSGFRPAWGQCLCRAPRPAAASWAFAVHRRTGATGATLVVGQRAQLQKPPMALLYPPTRPWSQGFFPRWHNAARRQHLAQLMAMGMPGMPCADISTKCMRPTRQRRAAHLPCDGG